MVALRHPYGRDEFYERPAASNEADAEADWLPLQQAACELGISISTARRRIRRGDLPNRVVPRRGGIAYLIYLPNSRHASLLGEHGCGARAARDREPISLKEYLRTRHGDALSPAPEPPMSEAREQDLHVRRLEEQVEHLSDALSRALRTEPTAAVEQATSGDQSEEHPFARYRGLVRRKRWWRF